MTFATSTVDVAKGPVSSLKGSEWPKPQSIEQHGNRIFSFDKQIKGPSRGSTGVQMVLKTEAVTDYGPEVSVALDCGFLT